MLYQIKIFLCFLSRRNPWCYLEDILSVVSLFLPPFHICFFSENGFRRIVVGKSRVPIPTRKRLWSSLPSLNSTRVDLEITHLNERCGPDTHRKLMSFVTSSTSNAAVIFLHYHKTRILTSITFLSLSCFLECLSYSPSNTMQTFCVTALDKWSHLTCNNIDNLH